VIGQDSAVVFLRQGSFVIRVHQSRIMPVKEQDLPADQDVNTSVAVENTEPVPRESLLGVPQYIVGDSTPSTDDIIEPVEVSPVRNPTPSTDQDVIADCQEEDDDDIEPVEDVSLIENWNNSFLDESSTQVSEVTVEVPDSQPENTVQEIKKSQNRPTVIKRGSTLIFVDDGEQYEAVVLSRAGKATGKRKNWYNVHVKETDEVISLDISTVGEYTVVNKDDAGSDGFDLGIVEDVYAVQLDDYAAEKEIELASWISNNVYEEVAIEELDARKVITSTWVCKESGGKKKARLVARGFLEDTTSISRDSPTCCKESLRLLLSIIAGKNWILQALDIKSAFLQGKEMERLVYMKPPREANAKSGIIWKLLKCVYGLVDASLKWYQRVVDCLIDLNGTKSKDPAVFYWRKDGDIVGVLALHVDDFMYAGTDEFLQDVIRKVKEVFLIKVEEKSAFTYLGLEIQQQASYIELDQKKYIEQLSPIDIPDRALKTRNLSSEEKNLLKSKLGQILWVSNHSRPDVSFQVCLISSGIKEATIQDFYDCNQVINKLKKRDVSVKHHSLGNLKNLKFVLFSDASHKNLYNGASQGGYIVFIKSDDSEFATPLIWSSKKLKRIVRSTLFAETYALLEAIDACIFLRRMTAQLLNIENIKIECHVDSQTLCDSVEGNKLNEDKRLRHEIECLRETVKLDNIVVHKVDTKLNVADVFTKAGAPSALILEVLETGVLRFDL